MEFVDALHRMNEEVHAIEQRVKGTPLHCFGEEFEPMTKALAMVTDPTPLLGLVVGGPKVGKTNMLINLALGLIENTTRTTVAFISAEVPRFPLRARLLCAHQARRTERGAPRTFSTNLVDLAPSGNPLRTMTREALRKAAHEMEQHSDRLFVIDRETLASGSINPRALHGALGAIRSRMRGDSLVIMLDYDAYLEVTGGSEGITRDEERLRILRALAQRHGALLITPHQARKGSSDGGGWNSGGFEATKGSGEFVYTADFVLHLRARKVDDEVDPGLHVLRGDMMNRHGAGGEFFFEARHDRAFVRIAQDQRRAEKLWDASRRSARRKSSGPDPAAVERVLKMVDDAVEKAGGNYTNAARVMGFEGDDSDRMMIRRAHVIRHPTERLINMCQNDRTNEHTPRDLFVRSVPESEEDDC